jgi:Ankyrin repeats (3 copies)/Ankyrin repeats (many copies)
VFLAYKIPADESSLLIAYPTACVTRYTSEVSSAIMAAELEPTLHGVVTNGRVQDILQLIEAGANMDERNEGGGHVLHVAVRNSRTDVVQILLDHGADVNVKGYRGYTPLHIACHGKRMTGRQAVIRQLLMNGADVDAKNNENRSDDDDGAGCRTPLHIAILYCSIQAIKLLLGHCADISIKEGEGYNALHWAVLMHTSEVLQERNRLHRNPMLHANRRGIEKAAKVVQMLLTHGTDVHAKIAHLTATTDGGEYSPPLTPEQVAYSPDMKEMLRDALLHAEQARRAILEAVIMGQHVRLGAASHIYPLTPEVVQMIIDRV